MYSALEIVDSSPTVKHTNLSLNSLLTNSKAFDELDFDNPTYTALLFSFSSRN